MGSMLQVMAELPEVDVEQQRLARARRHEKGKAAEIARLEIREVAHADFARA
jgi:hypothetical protein